MSHPKRDIILLQNAPKHENIAHMKEKITDTSKYEKRFRRNRHKMLKIAGMAVAVLIVLFVISRTLIGFSFVSGMSMYPTYSSGQLVFYSRIDKIYNVGDVIAMNYLDGDADGSFYIKRIVAAAGDKVEIKNGALYVNGELSEYGTGETVAATSGNVTYPLTVPENSFFVAGDNRGLNPDTGGLYSIDSRTFGPVSAAQIIGVLF